MPNLAEILGVSVDELMQIKSEMNTPKKSISEIVAIALKGVALAMGIAVTVLTVLDEVDVKSAIIMLGIGLASAGISLLNDKK